MANDTVRSLLATRCNLNGLLLDQINRIAVYPAALSPFIWQITDHSIRARALDLSQKRYRIHTLSDQFTLKNYFYMRFDWQKNLQGCPFIK